MSGNTDSDADERIAELEAEVEQLRDRVDHQYEILTVLVASIDSDALPEMNCPYCETGTVTTQNGMTWRRVECTTCDFAEYL
jgi:hypothetical protein